MGAAYEFTGDAVSIAEVRKITVGGAFSVGDTVTLTVGGRSLVITMGASEAAPAGAVAAIVAAWNGTAQPGTATVLPDPETAAGTFQEFAEVTAVDASPVVTLTMDTAGIDFAFTVVSGQESGSGTTAAGLVTAASGPNVWCADNFRAIVAGTKGVLPGAAADDTVYIRGSATDILWALNQNALLPFDLFIDQSYTGKLGLPAINAQFSDTDATETEYNEYRPRALGSQFASVTIGEGTGSGSQRIRLKGNVPETPVVVRNTGSGELTTERAVTLTGWAGAATLAVEAGEVDLDRGAGETSTLTTVNVSGTGSVRASSGTTIGTVNTHDSASFDNAGELTTLNMREASQGIHRAGDMATATNLYGGTLEVSAAAAMTLGAVLIGAAGVLDLSQSSGAVTLATTTIEAGATLLDPGAVAVYSAAIVQGGCGENDWTHDFGRGRTLAIAG